MIRGLLLWPVLTVALIVPVRLASGQPPPDYKIAFWYRRSDPLTSIRHQVYDVRRGEYTRAVDDWLETIRVKHPAYAAYVKDVRLKPGTGGASGAKKQLATVILQEYLDKGGPNGGLGVREGFGPWTDSGFGLPGEIGERPRARPMPRPDASEYLRGYGFINQPGANRPPSFLFAPGSTPPSPFPYPYVRPHP
jgi:hypothetical protein